MEGTPVNRPTYNVRLSDAQIRCIIKVVFPSHEISDITQLESDKSFNNRIYFIDVRPEQAVHSPNEELLRLVLKVCGHYFDLRKVENELASLLLLHKYCPDIPVPKAFAWSGDGKSIETVNGDQRSPADLEGTPIAKHPWILMNRLPGRSMTVQDLDGPHREQIIPQVAAYVNMWRTLVPSTSYFGNLRLVESIESPGSTDNFFSLTHDKAFYLGDLLLCNYPQAYAITSPLEYYSRYAQDQAKRLMENHLFANVRDQLLPIVKDVLSILPQIPAFLIRKSAKFTHFDLSPRNILVSETDSSQVTGLLDFEFAGFFPEEEEFVNAQVRQSDDWREEDWGVLMTALSSLGQKVPPTNGLSEEDCLNEQHWKQLTMLVQIIDSIAPWYIQEGAFTDQDLAKRLEEANMNLQDNTRRLQELLNVDGR